MGGLSLNPSLLARAHGNHRIDRTRAAHLIMELAQALPGPMFVQTLASDEQGILDDARLIHGLLKDRVIVKIPCTDTGLRITRKLTVESIPVCQTAVFSVTQAVISAAAGARWVAPYCNRITAAGGNGVATIGRMREAMAHQGLECRVLVASLKSVEEVEAVLLTGADHLTMPLALLGQLSQHPLTDVATARFSEDLAWDG